MTPGSAVRHVSSDRHVTDCATGPGDLFKSWFSSFEKNNTHTGTDPGFLEREFMLGVPFADFISFFLNYPMKMKKGVCALRGYFGPPMRSKNKSCSSQVSSYYFIRTKAKV